MRRKSQLSKRACYIVADDGKTDRCIGVWCRLGPGSPAEIAQPRRLQCLQTAFRNFLNGQTAKGQNPKLVFSEGSRASARKPIAPQAEVVKIRRGTGAQAPPRKFRCASDMFSLIFESCRFKLMGSSSASALTLLQTCNPTTTPASWDQP